jgi:hypothetical protein
MRAIRAFVCHPVALFRARAEQPWHPGVALLPPVLCAGLQFVTVRVLSANTFSAVIASLSEIDGRAPRWEAMGLVFGMVSALSYLATYALAVVTLVCLDVLLADSRSGLKLAELTGLAFVPQVVACMTRLIAVALWLPPWSGPPLASIADASAAVAAYRHLVFAHPAFITASVVEFGCVGWTIALAGVALHAVGKLPVRQVLLAGGAALVIYTTVYVSRLASGL